MNNNDKDKMLADALNECFEKMLAGSEPLDSCLARFPEQSAELTPLLDAMVRSRQAASVSPDPVFRARARYEFQRALHEHFERTPKPLFSLRLRLATAVSTLGVFLLAGGGSVAAASVNSMPGQALYDVKRSIENVQITSSPTEAAKARLYASLADRRVNEIVFAAQLGDAALAEDLTRQFSSDLGMISALAVPLRSSSFGNDSKGGSNTLATTSPEQSVPITSTAAATPSIAPGVNLPASTTATAAAVRPGAQVNLNGITDPVLLKLLQKYSVKNLSELMSLLDKVSPDVKAALLAAIQAANSGYGQLLGS